MKRQFFIFISWLDNKVKQYNKGEYERLSDKLKQERIKQLNDYITVF